jgi:hypothetical protein
MKPIDEQIEEIFRKWTYGDGYIHVPDCIKELLTLIQKERKLAYKEGYWERDEDDEEEKEYSEAEEAHRTEEGYCCACSYDMATMEDKIKKRAEEAVRGFVDYNKGMLRTQRFSLQELKQLHEDDLQTAEQYLSQTKGSTDDK